jgi:general secretion pathway protein F
MPRYSYTAYDEKGVRLGGEIESESREEALALLARQGRFPTELRDGAMPQTRWWERQVFGGRRLSQAQITYLTRELATLVKAELPLDEALRIVSLQPFVGARARQVVSGVLQRVLEGASLAGAMRGEGGFPDYYWRIVEAGETGGALGQSLEDLARFLERSTEFRQRVSSALLYPMLLLATACVALVVVVTVLIPAIVPLFRDAGVEPPVFIRVLAGLEDLIAANWPLTLVTCSVGLIGLFLLARHEPALRARDRVLLRIPIVSRVIESAQTTVMARTLATLLRNGVSMLQALQITISVVRNRAMAAGLSACLAEVQEGANLSGPMGRSGVFPDLAVRLIAVGEQSGQLDAMLFRVADIYDASLHQQLARATSLITPILTIGIGVMVGALLMSVMGAIVSLNDLAMQ